MMLIFIKQNLHLALLFAESFSIIWSRIFYSECWHLAIALSKFGFITSWLLSVYGQIQSVYNAIPEPGGIKL